MTAVSVEITQAVCDELKRHEFDLDFTPVRSYADWSVELEDLDVLHVDCVTVATNIETELSARQKLQYLVSTDIAVRKRFGANYQSDSDGRIHNDFVDPLVKLVEDIHELLTKRDLTGGVGVWQSSNIEVCPDAEALRTHRQFTGIIRVQFRSDTSVSR